MATLIPPAVAANLLSVRHGEASSLLVTSLDLIGYERGTVPLTGTISVDKGAPRPLRHEPYDLGGGMIRLELSAEETAGDVLYLQVGSLGSAGKHLTIASLIVYPQGDEIPVTVDPEELLLGESPSLSAWVAAHRHSLGFYDFHSGYSITLSGQHDMESWSARLIEEVGHE